MKPEQALHKDKVVGGNHHIEQEKKSIIIRNMWWAGMNGDGERSVNNEQAWEEVPINGPKLWGFHHLSQPTTI